MTHALLDDTIPSNDAVQPPPPKAKASRRRPLLVLGGALVLAAGGTAVLLAPKSAEKTDAAYVEADSSVVAPKVRGLVAEVLVDHNQAVKRGDPLLRIDPEEFDARVAAARAELLDAQAAVQAAQAAFVSLDAEERLAASGVRAAQTHILSADAQNESAQADRARYENLVASGAVAKRDVETYRAAAVSAQAAADRSRADFDVSRNQSEVIKARRATLDANLAKAGAAEAAAQAALDLALQDQAHTLIRAPIDGVVGDRKVEPGDYVQPGSQLMTVVPLGAVYVTANFKETQVARMLVGQSAKIKVDALEGPALTGKVVSFAPGSGSQFSLLPFEPGTGNFTKIVQRVPVRIRLDADQPNLSRLRPGLSTTVTVNLKSGA